MAYKIVVLVKQVPDTQNIEGNAMKEDGTVNRAALPAIFNPDDLSALEAALQIKDQNQGSHLTVITMGPPKASKVLKESLYRGADQVILLSDRKFAASDTLATSYALKCAIQKCGSFDIIICGSQAIDGDTAQVGPQTAEKLGINQLTFVSKIEELKNNKITAQRMIDNGFEILSSSLPVLITVTAENFTPRPPSAKKMMTYKNSVFSLDEGDYDESYIESEPLNKKMKQTKLWDINSIKATPNQTGLSGSPTKVKQVESVVLKSQEIKMIDNDEGSLRQMIHELYDNHTI